MVTAAQWEFDEESFDEITDEAQDFISSLLNQNTRWRSHTYGTAATQRLDVILIVCVFPRRRMSCKEALAHPWMRAIDSGDHATTKSLSKEKMKKFLARQKWKVTNLIYFPFSLRCCFSNTNFFKSSLTESRQGRAGAEENDVAL